MCVYVSVCRSRRGFHVLLTNCDLYQNFKDLHPQSLIKPGNKTPQVSQLCEDTQINGRLTLIHWYMFKL